MEHVLMGKNFNAGRAASMKKTNNRKQCRSIPYCLKVSGSEHFYPTRSDAAMYTGVSASVMQRLSSTTLRTNLGAPPQFHKKGGAVASVAAHHILPVSVIKSHISRLNFEDEDFFDSTENGIFLPTTGDISEEVPYHSGNHPDYSGHVGILWNTHRLPAHADTDGKQEKFIEVIQILRGEIADLGLEGRVYSRKPLDEIR